MQILLSATVHSVAGAGHETGCNGAKLLLRTSTTGLFVVVRFEINHLPNTDFRGTSQTGIAGGRWCVTSCKKLPTA
jgi:hypothetical protein